MSQGNLPEKTKQMIRSFLEVQNIYLAAVREMDTKLRILNEEFKSIWDRNPIHHIETRVKTPKSIIDKLTRKGYPLTLESVRKNLNDIAGVRVICSYIDDIYTIADLIIRQADVELLRTIDYIKNPKPNGYRSLHLIVTIPVYLSQRMERVKVEIQIRTIAMDFWASLEHELAYKMDSIWPEDITAELKACAEEIAAIDARMQRLYNRINKRSK
ncbi:MAG TPA: GTP pyrophosphokinase family protein [Firmicutes bacterium]|nr:GTP pyrophosphokinase family protein [Bacillota bacterium]